MAKIPIKVPTSRNEALWLFRAHGIECLKDQARIDPNPNGPAAELLAQIKYKADLDAAMKRMHVPIMPEPKPMTVGDLRRSAYTALKITCTRCWYENTVKLSDVPASRDKWPLKWIKFPHAQCAATGAGLVRCTPV